MLTPFDAKLIAILAISSGSYIFGILPALLTIGSRCDRSTVFSSVLCFGGGVLLATSIVHILPDVREDFPKWSEVVFCAGYFLIYFLDAVVQSINNPQTATSKTDRDERTGLLGSSSSEEYGSIPQAEPEPGPHHIDRRPSIVLDSSHAIPDKWSFASLGLLLAFSVHSIFEGLVIGVQTSPNGVFLLLGAVSCHKFLAAFCLGAELCSGGRPAYAIVPRLSVFVVSSVLGIVIGMIVNGREEEEMHFIVPILQGIAGGTLLYVAVSEILPRERAKDLPLYAPLAQFIALVFGFVVIVALTFYTEG